MATPAPRICALRGHRRHETGKEGHEPDDVKDRPARGEIRPFLEIIKILIKLFATTAVFRVNSIAIVREN